METGDQGTGNGDAPAARLVGVSKTFGRGATLVRALRDVDLDIRAGELTLIEGPSGSGKTTMLHILGLLQRADAGEIWIGQRRLDQIPESRLPEERRGHVSLIFQGHNLLESLTVRDNVAVAGLLRSSPELRVLSPEPTERGTLRTQDLGLSTEEHLRRLGLERRARHLPRELSGGEKQRTAIARALACRARLVLADEPTANLDWENAQHVVSCLADLAHRDGKAVVIVTHDSRLEPFADRIVGLLDGRVSSDRRVRTVGAMSETEHTSRVRAGPDGDRAGKMPAVRAGRMPAVRRRRAAAVIWVGVLLLALLGGATAYWYIKTTQPVSTPPSSRSSAGTGAAATPYVAAAPAVVEPGTRLVTLRAERRGRIKAILKHAGEAIAQGEPLILLDDATPRAMMEQRRADRVVAEANLAKLNAWHRAEERARARAAVERAAARLDRAVRELARIEGLYSGGTASETEYNQAVEERRMTAAALEEARQTSAIVESGPTREEVGVSEAGVEQARAAEHAAEAELALYTIAAPLTGHVIYRHLEPGEVVDPEAPVPILSVGNLDAVRLRAEVDEADIRRVFVGQKVIATAEAFGDQQFTGRVAYLEMMMGRKNIRTQRTTEQQDTKVREVLIELDSPGATTLPIDLQMTVRFIAAPSAPH